MLLSYQWLKKYVDLPEDLTLAQLSYDLTMRTVEVEGTEDLNQKYDRIVVGKICSVSDHPHADKLRICQVDVGEEAPVQIVCGGSNLEADHFVICSLPGSHVVWHGEGEPVEITASKLRGVDSYGMICGANEVGLSDLFPARDEHEIVDLTVALPEQPMQAGQPVAPLLGLDDFLIEIENKSLTNRPDLWGHYGIARELAAIYHRPLKELATVHFNSLPSFPVRIEEEAISHRMMATEIKGVDGRPSPLWLQVDLLKVGIRPINALVDWTNYMMMVTGTPTHAYDADHIQGGLRVRRAKEGESLTLLDERTLSLTASDIVIADDQKALGLAGCMGGSKDSISNETRSTVLEIANFNPHMIRKTAQVHEIRTEASQRHEKGLDTQRMDQTLGVAWALLQELFPEAEAVAFSDCCLQETQLAEVDLSLSWLSKRLGQEVSEKEVTDLLTPLGFRLQRKGDDLLHVLVPSFRSTGDVSLPEDLLEEVARMIGYEHFHTKEADVKLNRSVNQREVRLDRRIREYLAFQGGFYEIMTYPWVRDEALEALSLDQTADLALAAPPAPNQARLQPTLLPNLLDAVIGNLRYFDHFRLFECAQVYAKGASHPTEEAESLPLMHQELAAALVGDDAKTLFYQAKGLLEAMPRWVGMDHFFFQSREKPAWADKNAWVNICYRGQVIGELGLVSNQVKGAMDIKFHEVALLRFDMDQLVAFDSRTNTFKALPQYPHVFQDIALLFDINTPWASIIKPIRSMAESVSFVEEYTGEQVPEGKKSITLRIELASEAGTLTNAEINERMKAIRLALEKKGAQARY